MEDDEFNPENYKLRAGPFPVVGRITVAVRQYEDNPPKIRVEREKKNGDVRPFRGGLTAEEAEALAPALLLAAAALRKLPE